MVPLPVPFKFFDNVPPVICVAFGIVTSWTVTVAVVEFVAPLLEFVIVKVTSLDPMLLQSKTLGLTDRLVLQLPTEPLSTSDAVSV